jgi:hypothetical protein
MYLSCDEWYNSSGKYKIKELISRQLTPSFFEVMFREQQFTNQFNSAVSDKLPSVLMHKADDIVRPYVYTRVKELLVHELNNNMTIQDALRQQADRFNQKTNQQNVDFKIMLQSQQETLTRLCENHLSELKSRSEELLKTEVKKAASAEHVIKLLEDNLREIIRSEMTAMIYSIQQQVNDIQRECKSNHESLQRQITELKEENLKFSNRLDSYMAASVVLFIAGFILHYILK